MIPNHFTKKVLVFVLVTAVLWIASGCQKTTPPVSSPPPNTPAPQVALTSATATDNTLTLTFRIRNLPQTTSPQIVDNLVCRPYIDTRENIPLTFYAYEVHKLPQSNGNFEVVFHYHFQPPPTTTKIHLDTVELTIGPCAPAFAESNTTPQLTPLLADYKTRATVVISPTQP